MYMHTGHGYEVIARVWRFRTRTGTRYIFRRASDPRHTAGFHIADVVLFNGRYCIWTWNFLQVDEYMDLKELVQATYQPKVIYEPTPDDLEEMAIHFAYFDSGLVPA